MEAGPDFILIPKVRDPLDIIVIDKVLTSLEKHYKLDKRIRLIPIIETAEGLKNVFEISKSSDRIYGVTFGVADFTAEVGCRLDEEITFVPRLIVSFAAAAAGVQAIDTVYLDIKNLDGLRKDAERGRAMGYTGKFTIHPAQIDVINQVFTPTDEEVKQAQRIIEAYEEALKQGLGVVSLEGRMIDEALIKYAKKILAMARREEKK